MRAHIPAATTPVERISRSELFTGNSCYWAACRKDDADTGMLGPLMMPYAIPGQMLDNQMAEAVWARWYGSHKDARKAANLASRRLTPLEATSSSKLEDLSPFIRLTHRLDHDLMRLAADQMNAGASTFKLHAHEMMPLLRLEAVLEGQIGTANHNQISRLTLAAPAPDLAEIVESEFPFMKALHDKGAFLRGTARHLLGIACLLQTIKPEFDLPNAGKLASKLLITILVRSLPSRLGILVAVTNNAVSACFDWPCRFAGINTQDLQPGEDIWRKVPVSVLEETVQALQAYSVPTYTDTATNEVVSRLDRAAIAAAAGDKVGMELNAIHQVFLAKIALGVQDELKMLLTEGGIFFAATPYEVPADMVRPGFSLVIDGHESVVATALFSLILSTHFAGPIRPLLMKLANHKAALEKAGKKIVAMSGASPAMTAKTEKMGQKSLEELERGRLWFVEETMRLQGLVSAWAEFYSQLDALRRTA